LTDMDHRRSHAASVLPLVPQSVPGDLLARMVLDDLTKPDESGRSGQLLGLLAKPEYTYPLDTLAPHLEDYADRELTKARAYDIKEQTRRDTDPGYAADYDGYSAVVSMVEKLGVLATWSPAVRAGMDDILADDRRTFPREHLKSLVQVVDSLSPAAQGTAINVLATHSLREPGKLGDVAEWAPLAPPPMARAIANRMAQSHLTHPDRSQPSHDRTHPIAIAAWILAAQEPHPEDAALLAQSAFTLRLYQSRFDDDPRIPSFSQHLHREILTRTHGDPSQRAVVVSLCVDRIGVEPTRSAYACQLLAAVSP
jgi:hypothetical protein